MKRILSLLIASVFAMSLFANPVDKEKALLVASNFHSAMFKSKANLELVYQVSSDKKNSKGEPSETYYYVFSSKKSFVIVSGDDAVQPILAYSDDSDFDPTKLIPPVKAALDVYQAQIADVIKENMKATDATRIEWEEIQKGKVKSASKAKVYYQTAEWGQSPNENKYCPYDHKYQARTVTGCPATAMAIIMKYFKHPTRGTGSHSYYAGKYGNLSADFSSATYDYNKMPMTGLNASNCDEVAKLMYHCGIGVEMNYGTAATGGSGSFLIEDGYPKNQTCENAYKSYFGFNKMTMQGLYRKDFYDSKWLGMLVKELDEGRVLQYAGFGKGGHTFVFDGYQGSKSNPKFHVNWGWRGYMDGYYSINNLQPGGGGTGAGGGSYNRGQQAIIGLQPVGGNGHSNVKLAMDSKVTLDPAAVNQGETFNVTCRVKNTGSKKFSGQISAIVTNANGGTVTFVNEVNKTIYTGSATNVTLTATEEQSKKINPGTYTVKVVYKQGGTNDWYYVKETTYSNEATLDVTGDEREVKLMSNMLVSTGQIKQNKPFNVTLKVKNVSNEFFSGGALLALFNMDAEHVETVETIDIDHIPANGTKELVFSNSGVNLSLGTYYLALFTKTETTTWTQTKAGTGYSNPIKVQIVEGSGDDGDQYETNDTEATAALLNVKFNSQGKAVVKTTGSNLHNVTDRDYYKIQLPKGYNYSISGRVHDKNNSADGHVYTVDVEWRYKHGSSWSDTYNAEMDENLIVKDGGKVVFEVLRYIQATKGTYLLELNITRSEEGGGDVKIVTKESPSEGGYTSGGGDYPVGSEVTVEAFPWYYSAGYSFKNWTENGKVVSTEKKYVFTAETDRVLVANFTKGTSDKVKIIAYADPYTAGEILGLSEDGTFDKGATVELTASANDGYLFDKWVEDGQTVSTSETYSFTANEDRELVAKFVEDGGTTTYTISATANPTEGGSVSGAGKYAKGKTVNLKATAADDYQFDNWTEDNEVVSSEANYSFTAARDRDLVANFSKSEGGGTHYVRVRANPVGAGNVSGGGYFKHNTNVTVRARESIYSTKYKFQNWTNEDGVIVSSDKEYTFKVTKDIELTANFKDLSQEKHTVTVTAQPSYGGVVTGGGEFKHGEYNVVKATPAEGYEFVNWTVNNEAVSIWSSFYFRVESDVELVAHFKKPGEEEKVNVEVVANPTEGGNVTGAGEYDKGADVTITATANSGYEFVEWKANNTSVSTESSYKFTANEDISFEAIFVKSSTPTYTVTLEHTAGGSVTGGGDYKEGATATLTATPNNGYVFVKWTEGSSEVSTDATFTVEVTKNVTYKAHFKQTQNPTYTIEASVDPKYSGTVSGTGVFEEGTDVTLKAMPADGYVFLYWEEKGKAVSEDASYTFTVEKDRTLVAKFQKSDQQEFVIATNVSPENAGTVTGGGSYKKGTQATLTAKAKSGYVFVKWQDEGGSNLGTDLTYTFTVTKDETITAVFKEQGNVTYTVTATADPIQGGSIEGITGQYMAGVSATLTAVPNSGYKFAGWTKNNTLVCSTPEYTFEVNSDINLVAKFVKKSIEQFTVTANIIPAIGGQVVGLGTYEKGETVTLSAIPNSGYKFKNFKVDGSVVSNTQIYSFKITKDVVVEVNFTKKSSDSYSVTAITNPVGAGKIYGQGAFKAGVEAKLEVIANKGYKFLNWTVDGDVVSSNEIYRFEVTKDVQLVANFEEVAEQVSIFANASPVEGGVVNGAGIYSVGAEVTLTAMPNPGYIFKEWTINEVPQSQDMNYTFTVEKTVVVIAKFVAKTPDNYTISANVNPASAGTVEGAGIYVEGSMAKLEAVANSGYVFVNWTENGAIVSRDAVYEFTVNKDRALIANFKTGTTGISEEEISNEINIYPNPTNGVINIEYNTTKVNPNVEVFIYDVVGKVRMLEAVNSLDGRVTLDVSGVGEGVYYIQLVVDGERYQMEKVMIVK